MANSSQANKFVRNRIIVLALAFLIGSIIPFIDALVVAQMFYLIIPLALLAILSIAFLIYLLFQRKKNYDTLFLALVVPVLLVAEITVPAIVNAVQRYRAEQLVASIKGGHLPRREDGTFGLYVETQEGSDFFSLQYSRGFMVREVYDSQTRRWTSYGWND